jgi:NitT/TauT family transport system substrate-binding protein
VRHGDGDTIEDLIMSIVQSRRHFLAALSSITAAAVTRSSRSFAQYAPPETTTIRLAKNDGICIAPQYIANELLRLEGFTDIQHVTRLPTAMSTAIGRGDVDFSLEFAAQLIPAIETAVPVTVLAGVHVGCFELFAHEGIRSIRDHCVSEAHAARSFPSWSGALPR